MYDMCCPCAKILRRNFEAGVEATRKYYTAPGFGRQSLLILMFLTVFVNNLVVIAHCGFIWEYIYHLSWTRTTFPASS